jgi:hypothetical protein
MAGFLSGYLCCLVGCVGYWLVGLLAIHGWLLAGDCGMLVVAQCSKVVGSWLVGWLAGWLVLGLVNCSVGGWLVGRLVGWLVGCFVGPWMAGWVGAWLGGWVDGWLGDWVAGSLIDWLVVVSCCIAVAGVRWLVAGGRSVACGWSVGRLVG